MNFLCKMNLSKYSDYALVFARVLFGVLFFMHGLGKFTSGAAKEAFSMMWFAGVVEMVVGVAVVLGVFTLLFSLLGAGQMLVAYIMVHMPNGLSPLANKGELALLYFGFFVLLMFVGAGKYSFDTCIHSKCKVKD